MFEGLVSGLNNLCVEVFKTEHAIQVEKNGDLFSVEGIFDNNYISIDPGTNAPVMSSQPIIHVKSVDLGEFNEESDFILINNVRFQVTDSQEDSYGVRKLFLQKVRSRNG